MNACYKRALQYVKNTGGGATREIFIEDHEPVGETLWSALADTYIKTVTGRIYLTDKGEVALKDQK